MGMDRSEYIILGVVLESDQLPDDLWDQYEQVEINNPGDIGLVYANEGKYEYIYGKVINMDITGWKGLDMTILDQPLMKDLNDIQDKLRKTFNITKCKSEIRYYVFTKWS